MSDTLIPLNQIEVSNRLRDLDEDWAQVIASSITENGLLEPLVVREISKGKYQLVAGAHRYRGLEIAEYKEAPIHIREMNDNEARLAEIDENLMRHELSALDRAVFLAERKVVYEEMHPETKHGGDRGNQHTGGKWQTLPLANFTEDVAEKVGLSERTIRDAVALVKNLTPNTIAALRGTPTASNGAQLKALSRMSPSDQISVANMLKHDEVKNVAEGKRKLSGKDIRAEHPDDIWLRKMRALWGTGKKRMQDRFLAEIAGEQP